MNDVQPESEQVINLRARVKELEQLAFVPGLRRCAKCGCNLMTTTIHMSSGALSADSKPKDCPNGCGPMWPITERQTANESIEREKELEQRMKELEAALRTYVMSQHTEVHVGIRMLRVTVLPEDLKAGVAALERK